MLAEPSSGSGPTPTLGTSLIPTLSLPYNSPEPSFCKLKMLMKVCLYLNLNLYEYTYIYTCIYIYITPPLDTQTPSQHCKHQCETCLFVGRISAHFLMQHSYRTARQEKRKIPESKNLKFQKSQNPNFFARFRKCETFLDFWMFGCLEFWISDICNAFWWVCILFVCCALLLVYICSF